LLCKQGSRTYEACLLLIGSRRSPNNLITVPPSGDSQAASFHTVTGGRARYLHARGRNTLLAMAAITSQKLRILRLIGR